MSNYGCGVTFPERTRTTGSQGEEAFESIVPVIIYGEVYAPLGNTWSLAWG